LIKYCSPAVVPRVELPGTGGSLALNVTALPLVSQRRNHNRENGPATAWIATASNTNSPAVSLKNLHRNPEAQARPGLTFGGDEWFKYCRQHVPRNAHSRVSDGQSNQLTVLGNADPQTAASPHRVDGIADQVGDHLS
jgi:hypothetical protein